MTEEKRALAARQDVKVASLTEVDTITVQQLDAADQVTAQQVIRHFLDGRQPEVSK